MTLDKHAPHAGFSVNTKMFDNDHITFWRSNEQYKFENKIIGVEFNVIFFLPLSWFSRQFVIDDETVLHGLGTH